MGALAAQTAVDVLVAEHDEQDDAEERQEDEQEQPGDGGRGLGLGHEDPDHEGGDEHEVQQAGQGDEPARQILPKFREHWSAPAVRKGGEPGA